MPPSLTSIVLYLINFHLHVLVPSFVFCRSCFLNDQLFLQSFRAYSKKLFSSKDHIPLIFLKDLIFSSRSMQPRLKHIASFVCISKKAYIFAVLFSWKSNRFGFFFQKICIHSFVNREGWKSALHFKWGELSYPCYTSFYGLSIPDFQNFGEKL